MALTGNSATFLHIISVLGCCLAGFALRSRSKSTSFDYKQNDVPVELLRFVTAYRKEMEMLVDITPLSQFLNGTDDSTFLAVIETGASKQSYHFEVKRDGNNCNIIQARNGGNGWAIEVELLFWGDGSDAVVPRQTVMLSDGHTARKDERIFFGAVDSFEGYLSSDNQYVIFEEKVDLARPGQGAGHPIYDCQAKGSKDVREAALLGLELQETHHEMQQQIENSFLSRHFCRTKVEKVEGSTVILQVKAPSLHSLPKLMPGMAVFYSPDLDGQSSNLETAGSVVKVLDSDRVEVKLKHTGCITEDVVKQFSESLFTIRTSQHLSVDFQTDIVDEVLHINTNRSTRRTGGGADVPLVTGEADASGVSHRGLGLWQNLGRVKPQKIKAPDHVTASSQKVCVVMQTRSGEILTRNFVLHLEPGEKALLHLVTTAHGWAHTKYQCGEFCQAKYRIIINGLPAADIHQWRDDCSKNPVSEQYGTWTLSRNGWCPGSVQTGTFVDVTKFLNGGSNKLVLEMFVKHGDEWSKFTDNIGFAMQDDMRSSVIVTLNLLAYDAATVKRVQSLPTAYSAAELALRTGSSDCITEDHAKSKSPGKTEWLDEVMPSPSLCPSEPGAEVPDAQSEGPFNFEQPELRIWHQRDTSPDIHFGVLPEDYTKWVSRKTIYGDSSVPEVIQREDMYHLKQKVQLNDGKPWSRVAMRLKLAPPPGGSIGDWDMLGSVALVLAKDAPPAGVTLTTGLTGDDHTSNVWAVASTLAKTVADQNSCHPRSLLKVLALVWCLCLQWWL